MRKTMPLWIALALGAAASSVAADAVEGTFVNRRNEKIGEVEVRQTPNGVLVHAELRELPPGTHAFHLHETGKCEPPFKSAGSHFAPDETRHGFHAAEGPHAGDLPNVFVPDSGEVRFEAFAAKAKLDELLDDDGAAVVVHAEADDYRTDPAGAAGDRIACAVLKRGS